MSWTELLVVEASVEMERPDKSHTQPHNGELCASKNWEKKKPINRKHINIFLTAFVGQSSQGQTPTRPRDKRDKMAILLWN